MLTSILLRSTTKFVAVDYSQDEDEEYGIDDERDHLKTQVCCAFDICVLDYICYDRFTHSSSKLRKKIRAAIF